MDAALSEEEEGAASHSRREEEEGTASHSRPPTLPERDSTSTADPAVRIHVGDDSPEQLHATPDEVPQEEEGVTEVRQEEEGVTEVRPEGEGFFQDSQQYGGFPVGTEISTSPGGTELIKSPGGTEILKSPGGTETKKSPTGFATVVTDATSQLKSDSKLGRLMVGKKRLQLENFVSRICVGIAACAFVSLALTVLSVELLWDGIEYNKHDLTDLLGSLQTVITLVLVALLHQQYLACMQMAFPSVTFPCYQPLRRPLFLVEVCLTLIHLPPLPPDVGVSPYIMLVPLFRTYMLLKLLRFHGSVVNLRRMALDSGEMPQQSTLLALRHLLRAAPWQSLIGLTAIAMPVLSYALFAVERAQEIEFGGFVDGMWYTIMVMTTGELYDLSEAGRPVVLLSAMAGMVLVSLVVSGLLQELELDASQAASIESLLKKDLKLQTRILAASLIRNTWQWHRYKRLNGKPRLTQEKWLQVVMLRSKFHKLRRQIKAVEQEPAEETIVKIVMKGAVTQNEMLDKIGGVSQALGDFVRLTAKRYQQTQEDLNEAGERRADIHGRTDEIAKNHFNASMEHAQAAEENAERRHNECMDFLKAEMDKARQERARDREEAKAELAEVLSILEERLQAVEHAVVGQVNTQHRKTRDECKTEVSNLTSHLDTFDKRVVKGYTQTERRLKELRDMQGTAGGKVKRFGGPGGGGGGGGAGTEGKLINFYIRALETEKAKNSKDLVREVVREVSKEVARVVGEGGQRKEEPDEQERRGSARRDSMDSQGHTRIPVPSRQLSSPPSSSWASPGLKSRSSTSSTASASSLAASAVTSPSPSSPLSRSRGLRTPQSAPPRSLLPTLTPKSSSKTSSRKSKLPSPRSAK